MISHGSNECCQLIALTVRPIDMYMHVYMHRKMPLTNELLDMVIKSLQCVNPGPKRRVAFYALRPVLSLADNEMDVEFGRVAEVLRYLAQLETDRAALGRIHTHSLSCRTQSALPTLRRLM